MKLKNIIGTPKRYIRSVALTFVTIFSMIIGVYSMIEGFVFKQSTFSYRYFTYIAIISFIISNFMVLFFKINKITFFIQIVIVYSCLNILIYFMGFLFDWFSFKHPIFLIISFLLSLIGLLVFYLIFTIYNHYENKKINSEILKYQERVNKWEDS